MAKSATKNLCLISILTYNVLYDQPCNKRITLAWAARVHVLDALRQGHAFDVGARIIMTNFRRLPLLFVVAAMPFEASAYAQPTCGREISADVVALDQAFYANRLGALQTGGMIFALRADVQSNIPHVSKLTAGNVMLRPDKRPRPIVLRMNAGDCLTIQFQNLLNPAPAVINGDNKWISAAGPGFNPRQVQMVPSNPNPNGAPLDPYLRAQSATRFAGIHVMGMQPLSIQSDGSAVGTNTSSLAAPGASLTYKFFAEAEGAFLLYSTGADVGDTFGYGGQLSQGLFGAAVVQPQGAEWYRSQVTNNELRMATWRANNLGPGMSIAPDMQGGSQKTITHDGRQYKLWNLTSASGTAEVIQVDQFNNPVDANGFLKSPDFHPIINYQATYPAGYTYPSNPNYVVPTGTPILAMLDKNNRIVHTDLTAIITGQNAGPFPASNNDPTFSPSPSYPDRRQPYREFVIHYHDDFVVSQAFAEFTAQSGTDAAAMFPTVSAGRDFFAINYGIAAIGPEVWANRLGVGPMSKCATCRFEEFFLTSWAVGDPAMVVDFPANSTAPGQGNPSNPDSQIKLGPKATKAFYPDDPSNVYHSYLSDHTKFRILHAGTNITHVHHQHAHQWLHSPNSDQSEYRDSQMISPGSAYTLDYVYWGSGNKNLTVGDSIFHCHFYPHFAQGMWSLWRVHDVFEDGTILDNNGRPNTALAWNRALPDGEIAAGTPTPAVVPLPEYAMAPIPARVKLCPVAGPADFATYSGTACPVSPPPNAVIGYKALVNSDDLAAGRNPGFPYFVPGLAGQRPPAPPLDFAPDDTKPGTFLDGGLPRHVMMSELGTIYEKHNQFDFSKFNDKLLAIEVDEKGNNVEQAAMTFHEQLTHPSFTPEGQPKNFFTNGQPRASGAPYANPGVELDHKPVTDTIVYKAADIQTDVVLNKKGWHYPQQRMLALWGDVDDTLTNKRRPEPLFFRVNSGSVVEYWHTNLVPNYFELDDFQVRTPTDILGQHIHLVKFDVTSSDGAANGFNYEDGTLSPDEVQDLIKSVNSNNGLFSTNGTSQNLLTPKAIPFFSSHPEWLGAQTTIQRWYADPLLDNSGQDRTMRTVFTHDHFGPSTHQQIGLYAGLVIEPRNSTWLNSETGTPLGGRFDGGPTSWQAIIKPPTGPSAGPPYREFLLEFQDRQLAYTANSPASPKPYVRYPQIQPPSSWGWLSPQTAINPPPSGTPELVTKQTSEGTFSLNYSSEPLPYRVACSDPNDPKADLAHVFQSIDRCDPAVSKQPVAGSPIDPSSSFKFPPPQNGVLDQDPYTPLLRAYEGDHVQIRNLVGAHMLPHSFTVHGLKWLFEPAFKNSGYRSTQGMSLSEHYELLLQLPKTDAQKQADYLYIPSSGVDGLTGGNWGLVRAYKENQPNLQPITPAETKFEVAGCNTADQSYDITAVFARNVLNGPVVYNARGMAGQPGVNQIQDWNALMYVLTSDLDSNGKLKPGVPVEPLVLRANAGDCIEITLRNNLLPAGTAMNAGQTIELIGRPSAQDVTVNTSHAVGLHAQLVSYDVTKDNGVNVGLNPTITVAPGASRTFHWYAGTINDPVNEPITKTPIEFGAVSLTPADPMMQHPYGLVGALVIEPAGAKKPYAVDSNSRASATITKADGSKFREFVAVFHDDLAALRFAYTYRLGAITSNGKPQWVTFSGPGDVTGKPLTQPLQLQPGDTVAVMVNSGFHGLTFLNGTDAKKVFKFVGGVQFQPQPSIGADAWGTPGQTVGQGQNPPPVLLGVLQVKPASEFAGISTVPFECTVHQQNMQGSFAINTGPPNTLTMAGAIQNGSVVWLQNGSARVNGSVTAIKPGMTITFSAQNGTHGIEFLGNDNADAKAKMEKIFDITSGGQPFKNQGAKGWGTDGVAGPAAITTLTVKNNIPPDIVSIDFQCTVHTVNMAGRFEIDLSDTFSPPNTVPAGVTAAINYRTEPFQYRFTNAGFIDNTNANAAVGGLAPALTDGLVGGDPQTPVFAAPKGMPVRMRMVHPAGTSEEILTLHGQVWQEEPYSTASTEIGSNNLSQSTGSRDAFGANASFDMVLNHAAGGAFSSPGDYLFRTFIGNDFMDGMWGLVRVGEGGQDIVRVTRYQQVTPTPGSSKPRILVTGANTVNTSTGQMAPTVTVFAGTGASKTKIADATVDSMSGTWQLESDVASVPATITVVSAGGGSVTATVITPAAPRQYTLRYPSDKGGQSEKTLFRPERHNSEVKGEAAPSMPNR